MQELEILDITSIIASGFGIVLFIYSIYRVYSIIKMFPEQSRLKKYWYALTGLIGMFIIGYSLNVYAILANDTGLAELLIPGVYFLGSVFVFIIIMISHQIYKIILTSSE